MSFLPKKVFVLSALRTPMGSFGGQFAGICAVDLGTAVLKAVVSDAKVDAENIDELYFGNVVSAALGQAPAKQVARHAGLSSAMPCTLVNKVCASGMKSVMLGAQSIALGINNIVAVGGMEHMSGIPYYQTKSRWGSKYGSVRLLDGLEHDGLTDPYALSPMGGFADATASKYGFSREDQDAYAIESYTRATKAWDEGKMQAEVTPVEVASKKGVLSIGEDEEYKRVNFEKIPKLRPAFSKDGTVTAANASTINDGAAAMILASEEAVKAHGLTPIAEIVSFADASQEPEWFTTTPPIAMDKALLRANKVKDDMDFWEVNEAFSTVAMAFNKDMALDSSIVNVFGGAVSLGHPLGASGARILITLLNVLRSNDAQWGGSAICNGGGGASAMVLRRV